MRQGRGAMEKEWAKSPKVGHTDPVYVPEGAVQKKEPFLLRMLVVLINILSWASRLSSRVFPG
ncbi:MAG: hypothetical protein ACOYS2_00845 [Patescibacteria group bacterium]